MPLGQWYPELDDCFLVAVTEKRTKARNRWRWSTSLQLVARFTMASTNTEPVLCVTRRDTKLLFELSEAGRRAHRLPACDVPERPVARIAAGERARRARRLPCRSFREPQVVRHFANLSQLNMSVDTHFYPLGSCTMKYNPKRNERVARMPGFADLHPYQPEETLQGMLQLLYELQEYLQEISGLAACSLQPAAGAHGELTALLVAAAYFRDRGEKRTKVLVPDSAHGTNPASATMAGFETVTVKTLPTGSLDMDDLRRQLDDQIAVFMITNPNTVGIFEPKMREIADAVHERGGLVYLDGANMNAILGIARPGDFGADMQHYNPHKTFSGPHGGGGPGAGPICVTEKLAPYLPTPVVAQRRRALPPRLQPPQIDRPRPGVLRQHRRAGAGLLLHPHARPRRPAARERERRAQRQLPAQPREAFSARAAGRPLHARVRRLGRQAQKRKRHLGDGPRQAAARTSASTRRRFTSRSR